MSRTLTTRLLRALTLTFWAFLFITTHIPQPKLPGVPVSDKTAHLISYGVLASMLYITLWLGRPGDWSSTWKVPLILTLYGAFDEATQPLVNRSGEFADWYADVAGATIAVAVWSIIRLLASTLRSRQATGKP